MEKFEINAFLSLYGIWLAEGSMNKSGVSIAAHKLRVRVKLEEIIPILNKNVVKIQLVWEKIFHKIFVCTIGI